MNLKAVTKPFLVPLTALSTCGPLGLLAPLHVEGVRKVALALLYSLSLSLSLFLSSLLPRTPLRMAVPPVPAKPLKIRTVTLRAVPLTVCGTRGPLGPCVPPLVLQVEHRREVGPKPPHSLAELRV